MPDTFFSLLKKKLKPSSIDSNHCRKNAKAAVALILYKKDNSWNFIMIKRAVRKDDPWSGQMAFPGGRREESESMLQTAIRETQEEIGLTLEENEMIGRLNPLKFRHGSQVTRDEIWPFLFYLKKIPRFKIDPVEVDRIVEVPFLHLLKKENHDFFEYSKNNLKKQLPRIVYQEHPIWGLSYQMLGNLIELLQGFPLTDNGKELVAHNPWRTVTHKN